MGFATVIGQAFFVILFMLLFAQMYVMQHRQNQLQTELFSYQQKQLQIQQATVIQMTLASYNVPLQTLHVEVLNVGSASIPFNTSDFYISTTKTTRSYTTRKSFACYAFTNQQCGEIGFDNGTNGENDDLQVLYHFDADTNYGENPASTAMDFSNTEQSNLTLNNLQLRTDCLFDQCYRFSAGYASAAHTATNAFNNDSSYTWSFWIAPAALSQVPQQIIVSKATASTGYEIFLDTDNRIKLRSESAGDVFPCANHLTIGEWSHIAIIYTQGDVRCYQDGVSINNITNAVFEPESTADLILGADYTTGAGFLNASLDEFAIYNTSKTDLQIRALYRRGVYVGNKQSLDAGERLAINYPIRLPAGATQITYSTSQGSSANGAVVI